MSKSKEQLETIQAVHDELEALFESNALTVAEYDRLAEQLAGVAGGDGNTLSVLVLFEPNAVPRKTLTGPTPSKRRRFTLHSRISRALLAHRLRREG